MAKVEKFGDLVIFPKTHDLSKDIYNETGKEPWKSDSRFVQQIRAAAVSVMDNMTEGFERDGNKEFKNFLYIAKGSCGEVRTQVIRAYDAGFINVKTSTKLYDDCIALNKSIALLNH